MSTAISTDVGIDEVWLSVYDVNGANGPAVLLSLNPGNGDARDDDQSTIPTTRQVAFCFITPSVDDGAAGQGKLSHHAAYHSPQLNFVLTRDTIVAYLYKLWLM